MAQQVSNQLKTLFRSKMCSRFAVEYQWSFLLAIRYSSSEDYIMPLLDIDPRNENGANHSTCGGKGIYMHVVKVYRSLVWSNERRKREEDSI